MTSSQRCYGTPSFTKVNHRIPPYSLDHPRSISPSFNPLIQPPSTPFTFVHPRSPSFNLDHPRSIPFTLVQSRSTTFNPVHPLSTPFTLVRPPSTQFNLVHLLSTPFNPIYLRTPSLTLDGKRLSTVKDD